MTILESRKAMANRPSPVAAIRLTPSAQAYADRHGLTKAIEGAMLGADAAAGDLVSVATGGGRVDFAIVSRRWIISGGAAVLELTLDHPAHRGA